MHGSTRGLVALTALAGAIAALILTPVGSARTLRVMGTPATYADPAGDAKSAPDVVSISVDLDAASGGLRFDIGFANAEQLANGGFIAIALDSDRNSGTGDRAGSDYLAAVFADGVGLLKWNGTEMAPFNHQPLVVARSPGKITIGFCSCDIGTQSFAFAVVGIRGNDVDVAPDAGATFPIQANAVTIRSLLFVPKPVLPKAGKRYTLKDISIRLEGSNEIVVPDSVACSAKLAVKVLKGTGPGGCSWLLPKKSRGKSLTLTVNVSYQGQTETFSQTFKVT